MDTVDKATKSKHINTLRYTTVTRIAGATTDRAAYESKAQPASLEKLLLAPGTFSCPIYYFTFHGSYHGTLRNQHFSFSTTGFFDYKDQILKVRMKLRIVPSVHRLAGAHQAVQI